MSEPRINPTYDRAGRRKPHGLVDWQMTYEIDDEDPLAGVVGGLFDAADRMPELPDDMAKERLAWSEPDGPLDVLAQERKALKEAGDELLDGVAQAASRIENTATKTAALNEAVAALHGKMANLAESVDVEPAAKALAQKLVAALPLARVEAASAKAEELAEKFEKLVNKMETVQQRLASEKPDWEALSGLVRSLRWRYQVGYWLMALVLVIEATTRLLPLLPSFLPQIAAWLDKLQMMAR